MIRKIQRAKGHYKAAAPLHNGEKRQNGVNTMDGEKLIKQYKFFESFDSIYRKFERYINQYLTADLQKELQEMISLYNSTILKWERFTDHLKSRSTTTELLTTTIFSNVKKAIYTALENDEKVNILTEIEKAAEEYRRILIQKGRQ